MLTHDVDFDSLVGPPKPASFLEKILQRARKIALISNWRQFVTSFAPANAPTSKIIPVYFRNGMILNLRSNTQDIDILHEVFLERDYASLEKMLKALTAPATVVDLGAHIGSFSLRSVWANPFVYVDSYEPSADNRAALGQNIEINRPKTDRIRVHAEAVAGAEGTAQYFHDPTATTDSSLYGNSNGMSVLTVSLRTVFSRCTYPITLLKIDIEGAEYAVLHGTVGADWDEIPAVMVEIHADPSGVSNPKEWLRKMYDFGFRRQTREHNTILLQRN